MSYIRTYLGNTFNPSLPTDLNVEIVDIAHALSYVNRYNGHLTYPYSVAQHSLHVCEVLEDFFPDDYDLHIAGLMHDAGEAYLPDVTTPVKALMPEFIELENTLVRFIFKQLELPFPIPDEVHTVDKEIRISEMTCLAPWGWLETKNKLAFNKTIHQISAEHSKDLFLKKYHDLQHKRGVKL